MNCFSNLSYSSSSVGSDHTGQPSLPTSINEPWLPMTLAPVHRFTSLDHFCFITLLWLERYKIALTQREMQADSQVTGDTAVKLKAVGRKQETGDTTILVTMSSELEE
ncbi:hypothetical protein NQZ68_035852 [Dissostichus eleginoides]|nr:hypothetical protein NQZ68_035852 [Dissostichus eleginoides]